MEALNWDKTIRVLICSRFGHVFNCIIIVHIGDQSIVLMVFGAIPKPQLGRTRIPHGNHLS